LRAKTPLNDDDLVVWGGKDDEGENFGACATVKMYLALLATSEPSGNG